LNLCRQRVAGLLFLSARCQPPLSQVPLAITEVMEIGRLSH